MLADCSVGIFFGISVVTVQLNFYRSTLSTDHYVERIGLFQDIGFVSIIQHMIAAYVGSKLGYRFVYTSLPSSSSMYFSITAASFEDAPLAASALAGEVT